jgi:aminopeptidase N
MQHYFNQWKFAHPYFEDFRASIIRFTNVDLNWFFDEWIETTKTIDYSVEGIHSMKGTDTVAIKFRRHGQMQMPVDFTVQQKDGTEQSYHIPNTWFTKSTEATVLPKWYGWSKIRPEYTAYIKAPSGVKAVRIDTTDRLADINPLNNNKTKGLFFRPLSYQVKLDGGLNNPTDRRHYRLYIRPDLWWNPIDGIKAGAHLEGNYLNTMHRLDATVWWNTHLLQDDRYKRSANDGWYSRYMPFNFTLNYITPVSADHPDHEEQANIRVLDGLIYGRLGHNWRPNEKIFAQFYYQAMWRPLRYDLEYLIYPNEWSGFKKRPNNSLNLVLARYRKGFNSVSSGILAMRAPLLTGNERDAFNYGYIQFTGLHTTYIKRLELRTRIMGRIGMGTSIPYESALWLAGANPEELMENKYTRSKGFVAESWQGISRYETNHFQMGGGLNLRGYAGYFVADERGGELFIGYKGRSGAAANLELDLDNYIRVQPKFTKNWLHIDAYGFADGGVIELSKVNTINNYYNSTPVDMWSDFRMDAGLGLAFTIKQWGVFEKASPLTIRFDMPLFINRPPYANPQYVAFRYVVGINRSF